MNKKLLKQFVTESFTKGGFDEKKIEEVANSLSRKNLKVFINELKEHVNKLTVYVDTALPLNKGHEYIKELENIFPNRKIEFRLDPSLIMGVRIIDNDNIFELNVNNLLHKMERHIVEII